MGHARALLALDYGSRAAKLRDEILAHDWSVRATEATIRAAEPPAPPRRPPPPAQALRRSWPRSSSLSSARS